MRKVRLNLGEKNCAEMRWILTQIFGVKYSTSCSLQCVLSNSEEEKQEKLKLQKLHSATQKGRHPLQLLVCLAIKCSLWYASLCELEWKL